MGLALALASCRGAAIEVRYLDTDDSGSSDVTITATGPTTGVASTGDDDPDTTTGPIPMGTCPQAHVIQADAPVARRFEIADLDGDGVHELLAVDTTQVSPGTFVVSLYYLVPTGDVFQAVELAFELPGEYVGFADLDGDGLEDLFLFVDDAYAVVPLLAAPQFVLGEPRTLPPLPAGATFFDVDEDGLTDVIVTDADTTQLIGIGDGGGTFDFLAEIGVPNFASMEVIDARTPAWYGTLFRTFTDAGCLDGSIAAIAIDSSGSTTQARFSDTAKYARLLDLVDIDGSGVVDVFVETCEEPEGTSVGAVLLVATPDTLVPILTIGGLGWAESADLDGNGEVDVVFASAVDGAMAFHPLVGGAPTPAVGGGAAHVAATAHGHGRLFADDGEQVLLSYPTASGTTWAYVSGDPC